MRGMNSIRHECHTLRGQSCTLRASHALAQQVDVESIGWGELYRIAADTAGHAFG